MKTLFATAMAAVALIGPVTLPANVARTLASASAASCPDVEVVFARGRFEPAGTGALGNAFVSALRSRVHRNIGVYAVNYPADTQVDVGANDMSGHIQNMVNNCPNTRLVLGGYSLGAAVTDMVLALPGGFSVPLFNVNFSNPLPDGADQHIAAVALFGNGTQWIGPITNFNPAYSDRTIDLCHGADPICNPADPNTWQNNWPAHLADSYIKAGMPNQAADFVAGKL